MDEIRKERIKKEIHEKNKRKAMESFLNRQVDNGFKFFLELSWPKYLTTFIVIFGAALVMNLPLVKEIHFDAYLNERRERMLDVFYKQLDKEEARFQQNLLKKFRKDKRMETINVTDEELKKSKFFD